MINVLQQLSEELLQIIDVKLSEEHLILGNDQILEWENEKVTFHYDTTKQIIFVHPKVAIEHLDVIVTILPNEFDF